MATTRRRDRKLGAETFCVYCRAASQPGAKLCGAKRDGLVCTRESGHPDDHRACSWTLHSAVIWSDDGTD